MDFAIATERERRKISKNPFLIPNKRSTIVYRQQTSKEDAAEHHAKKIRHFRGVLAVFSFANAFPPAHHWLRARDQHVV
jgi:hypothetical protein